MQLDQDDYRFQLQPIIEGLADGVVLFQTDGCISWANTAALAMHGIQQLDELGGDVSGYQRRFELRFRDGHVLDPSEYPSVRALAGEELRDIIIEVRQREGGLRCTHRVRSLFLRDKAGHLSLCALILVDATREFSAEDRFEKAFGANPAPALICRLADLRFIKVNRGFLELTGYHREDLIGRSLYEIDVLEGADGREQAIRSLEAGRMIPQSEVELRLPGGGSKLVIVSGQPIEIGVEPCMLFSFIDLEERRRAYTALAQSEERFAVAFRLAPVPMLITSLADHRILDANDAFVRYFGHERSKAVGRSKADLALWADDEVQTAAERQLQQTDRVQTIEVKLKTASGVSLDCLLTSEGVSILDRRCVLTVIQDITARRQVQSQLVVAVESVMQDTTWLGEKIVAKVNSLMDETASSPVPGIDEDVGLSGRERQVLALIAQGASDKATAQALRISVNTVKNHVSAIYRKTGITKRANAVVWARHHGIGNYIHEKQKSKR